MARQNHKQKYKGEDGTGGNGEHHHEKKTVVDRPGVAHGQDRRANQILHWFPEGRKRRERPRKNWADTVKNDLRGLEISWERAEELAMDRVEWRRCVARCTVMHRMD